MQLEERLGGLKRPQLDQTAETRDMFKLLFRGNKRFCQNQTREIIPRNSDFVTLKPEMQFFFGIN